jgi:hypothetical protein
MMRKLLSLGMALTLLLVFAALSADTASANPTGLLVNSEACAANGTVQAYLHWTPDSGGQQFVDLSGKNDNFTSNYSTGGPYTNGQTQAQLTQLKPNTSYYLRVSTLIGTQFLRSATLTYTTRSCGVSSGGGSTSTGGATPPTNLQAAAFSVTGARFQWVPGNGNVYFCVDYAKNAVDLINFGPTWRNSGCGTTSYSHVINNLACGTTYYARIWTPAGGGLYSPVRTITTYSCANAISAPTNLGIVFETTTTARLAWQPGKDNLWFCVDTAKTQADLLNYTGTWRNYGCWTTSSQLTIDGLTCETKYYWRVYAWNTVANVHSETSVFTTDACDSSQAKAPIESVSVAKVSGDYYATIVVGKPDSCHSFGSYTSDVQGTTIKLTVLNSVSDDDVCADVYSTYTLVINLGHNFVHGVTYVVLVNNDESDAFTAN